jgi:hypothetical protein
MAKFTHLELTKHYDIIDAETGHWLTQGIQGADAMAADWPNDSEAWDTGETEFDGKPLDIAKANQ